MRGAKRPRKGVGGGNAIKHTCKSFWRNSCTGRAEGVFLATFSHSHCPACQEQLPSLLIIPLALNLICLITRIF
ncbi:hypothetical protein BDV40DRAFT_179292 [Aspergillus tamarii]|uniref:Uncharacterized protein n=1 Tax=Aspergillus tamarii TaxID=41984 RepID=A0A5N6UT54_ASPTM|nr:hypothetical protein BDV40DRAFT_179292 [Aspergillus tamarii]